MPSIAPIFIATSGGTVITVTVGTNAGSYGFNPFPFGSVSPASLYGLTIVAINTSAATNHFVVLNTVVSASFFNRVTFKAGASAANSFDFTSASATFTNPGGTQSQWQWTGNVWTATDNGLARFAIFYR